MNNLGWKETLELGSVQFFTNLVDNNDLPFVASGQGMSGKRSSAISCWDPITSSRYENGGSRSNSFVDMQEQL